MAEAPLGFRQHGLVAFAFFALWPFTRPYIVYRSRDDQQLGSHTPRRGWERSDR